jgi:hypothetical protein
LRYEGDVAITVTGISPPFPLADRLFVDARYLYPNPKDDEYIAIFSSRGNDEIMAEYVASAGIPSSTVLGKAYMSGHWYRAMVRNGEVVGTKIFYVN